MKCRVTNVRSDDNEKCKGVVELVYLEKLPVHIGGMALCLKSDTQSN